MDEYNALRAELLSKQEQKRSVWLHMYILYISLFVLAVETSYSLILLTFVVIIPYQEVLNNLEWNVSRISAYIRIFYEDNNNSHHWETMNTKNKPYTDFLKDKKINTLSGFIRNAGSVHLGLFSTVFYIASVVNEHYANGGLLRDLSVGKLIVMLVVLLLLAVVVCENMPSKQKCEQELQDIIAAYKKECDTQGLEIKKTISNTDAHNIHP